MLKRFAKVFSVPVFLLLVFPVSFLSGLIWAVTNKFSPTDLIGDYFDWLEDD